MTLTKIISGVQTGADRAALDFALEFNIPHGGWVPKGRKAEDGVIPDIYELQEMPTASYPKRTEQNVMDSEGTLIFSHGELTGGSALTQQFARRHERPSMHVDLTCMRGVAAARQIASWISEHKIKVLNVAGSRASNDPAIYAETLAVLRNLFLLGSFAEDTPRLPTSVEKAVKALISALSLTDRSRIARMREDELGVFHHTLGQYIRNRFGLWSGNEKLKASCRTVSAEPGLSEDGCSALIIRELWSELRKTHALRAVK